MSKKATLKNVSISIVVILLMITLGAYCYFSGKEYVFTFSEKQLYEQLSSKLPLTKKYLFIFEITLNNPRVNLINGSNRVTAGLDVGLNIWINKAPKSLGGTLDASGGIQYVKEDGAFFLTDPIIENLAVQGIPQKHLKKVNQVLTKALTEYYEAHPIYTLKPTDVKKAAARLVLKNVIIENQQLVITLGI